MEPFGEQIFQNQNAEPLFKTKQADEETLQKKQFQDQFMHHDMLQTEQQKTTEQKKTQTSGDIANTFLEQNAREIKADADGPLEPEYSYVNLKASCLTVTKNDDKKMAAVKEAINKLHDSQGGDDEMDALQAVIKACNSYTWGKFSIFKFGQAKVKLNEVKRVRQEAEARLAELKQQQKKTVEQADNNVFPNVEVQDKKAAKNNMPSSGKKYQNKRTKELKKTYPELSQKALELIAEHEFQEKKRFNAEEILDLANEMDEFSQEEYDYINQVFMDLKEEAEEEKEQAAIKQARRENDAEVDKKIKDLIQQRLNEMNPFKRFFYNNFYGREVLRNEILRDEILKTKFANDVQKNVLVKETVLSKNDTDNESTFI